MSSPSPDTLDILVVDDSATYRMLLARAVKSWPSGNPVGSAGDGEQALSLIAQVKPDLVLLDVTMPVLDGIETLKRIRARWADVDVIMCSGVDSGQTGLTMQALSLGALDFVPKPVCDTPAESFAALSSALLPLLGLALERKRRRTLRASPVRPPLPASPAPVVTTPPTAAGASLPSLRPTLNPSLPTVPPPRAIVPPVRSAATAPSPQPPSTSLGGLPRRPPARIEVLVVGVSTGGPNAVQQVDDDGAQVLADTIIIQEVPTRVLDEEGRREMDTIGSGLVRVIQHGMLIRGTWKKEAVSSRTRFYDVNGEEIALKPGTLWVQIVPPNTPVTISS
jgi:two-component system chemotaxis response regulator CheB